MSRTGFKRKGYISRKDREQDQKIRRLEQQVILKELATITSVSLTTSIAQEFSLINIPQGETDITREGATARLMTVAIRWSLGGSPVPTVASGSVRIMLFIDSDPRGALPTATDYLRSQNILSSYNVGREIGEERNRGRFKFLFDQTFDIINRPIASADSLPSQMTGKIFAKLGSKRVLFTGDSGAITEIEENDLILAAIAGGNTEVISFAFNSIVRFTAPD